MSDALGALNFDRSRTSGHEAAGAFRGEERRWPLDLPAVSCDGTWTICEDGFVLAREHEIESLLTVANGCLGVRGSVAEGTSLSDPATFVAGVFDVEPHWNSIPGLMVLANWTDLRVMLDGRPLCLETGETLRHSRVLDMRSGLLGREWVHRDESGRLTRLRFLRFASRADRCLAVQSVSIVPENYSGEVRVESRIGLSAARARRWEQEPSRPRPSMRLTEAPDSSIALFLQSTTTGVHVACAIGTTAAASGGELSAERRADGGDLVERWTWAAQIGEGIRFDRFLAVDRWVQDAQAAGRRLQLAIESGADQAIAEHKAAWSSRWTTADVQVEGDDDAARALRFAIYHLVSAANEHDSRVSIGARALTGESYRGHVFWDTEIYLLPFYIYTDPAAARSLLEYRHRTMPGARRKAQALGYRGALYAWESTDTGDETTPTTALTPTGEVVRILTGQEEHHISADVAYACWLYWQVTGDDRFMIDFGAEIVLETARFWASRGALESDGCYHIRRVIGPDEYHETVDDNAYTNVMARWNLQRGVEIASLVQQRWPDRWNTLARHLEIGAEEIPRWRTIAESMKTGFDRRTGLFEQFQGYHDLEDIPLSSFEPRNAPIDIILQRERLQQSRIVKQADVVALSALLWDELPHQVHEANFRYYEPRTAHGSSLSPAMHALVAARLGDDLLFDRYFRQAAEIDLANNMGNAAGGVHIAALGGLWQAAVLGVGGIRPRADGLVFDPHMPRTWAALRFSVQWRSRRVSVVLDRSARTLAAHVEGDQPIALQIEGAASVTAEGGTSWRARHCQSRWSEWEKVE